MNATAKLEMKKRKEKGMERARIRREFKKVTAEELREASENGTLAGLCLPGDEFFVFHEGLGEILFNVIGKDTDMPTGKPSPEGTITLQTQDLIFQKAVFSWDENAGWKDSEIRSALHLKSFFDGFEKDFKELLVPTRRMTGDEATVDIFFLPSSEEVFGSLEAKKYSYYENERKLIKFERNGRPGEWRLRDGVVVSATGEMKWGVPSSIDLFSSFACVLGTKG